ncbi:sugar ABC transporter permease [Marinomonas ostreistagni]|uniref:Xylose transport system permease protein XylH n=1 Tax=Marinomonas ostreistagni TaxID=359209 RepID=A0ABS0ZG52_9GAMM|nr:sugar ABC transporter permease [Marinomonas ostreistagni]MBJ7552644.1 sugar ABC transporter permease [Marinomonas ostreistagni]
MSSSTTNKIDSNTPLLDRSDERVNHDSSIGDVVRSFVDRVKSGDLGSLPVVVGLIIIWSIFTAINPVFLSANNLVNLLFDSATVGIIALGIVCVLMLGEIDLSVGSLSGVGSALLGVLWVKQGLALPLAMALSLSFGACVGMAYAYLRTRFGMPSFVATLAGLLALLGFQLFLLGSTGSINLPYSSSLVDFGQLLIMPAWLSHSLALLPGIVFVFRGVQIRNKRMAMRLSAKSLNSILVKAVLMTVALEMIVMYLNQSRGVPWMFGLFLLLVIALNYALTRTKWGRYMFAVGGNVEAARRVGIKVERIYMSAFILCSTLATLGGMLAAARLASASQQAGTGDVNLNAIAAAVIGGTSLFGGRGSAWSALLGIIVIMSIANGLTLLNLSSAHRYMITGAVLAVAVIIDSLARQSRQSHGKA